MTSPNLKKKYTNSDVLTMKKLALALKNKVALNFFTVLKYFLSFRILEQLALALKNRVCPEIFHGVEYIFYHSEDF